MHRVCVCVCVCVGGGGGGGGGGNQRGKCIFFYLVVVDVVDDVFVSIDNIPSSL